MVGIAETLDKNLPDIIINVAKRYEVAEYQSNPDFLEPRMYSWHQFGLLTHTRKVRDYFRDSMDFKLTKWGVYSEVERSLNVRIGDIRKKDLLEAAILLHDLGKIPSLGDTRINRVHEMMSLKLLEENPIKEILASYNLTKDQINYLGYCVKAHDVLGKEIRDKLKHQGNLNFSYLGSVSRSSIIQNTDLDKEMLSEIGVFFLCDTMGKTDIYINAASDEEINLKKKQIESLLESRGLPNQLVNAVMQFPVSIKLSEIYFKSIMSCLSSG